MSNMSVEETVDEIHDLYQRRKERMDVITMTNQEFTGLYGGSNYPREEPRNRMRDLMRDKYQLWIVYMDKCIAVLRDANFSPTHQ